MNHILTEICNGRHDMLIGLFTVAILTGCVTFLLRLLFVRTKKVALNTTKQAIENKKLEIELQTLENRLAALKQPRPPVQAPLRRPMQTGNMADLENGFDADFDFVPMPDYMKADAA
jgi:hypothetical protein